MITLKSRVRDVLNNPVGHDVVHKLVLQLGLPRWVVRNTLVGGLRLSFLKRLTRKTTRNDFFDAVLTLLNQSPPVVPRGADANAPAWWKEAVFYQIYPHSFGTLRDITDKLDYLKDLGITALWLSPIYDSPQDDNGYDIRDYEAIDPKFGTMADFDALITALHAREMRLIMDLVVNHTSDEHPWFRAALNDADSPYRAYYHFAETPNNWTSFFSGAAWNECPDGSHALHLFSKKQMDLNWDNDAMRQDIHAMVRRWLSRGVDGFRLDVINYISKTPGLPDGNEFIGNLMEFRGVEHYFHGPRLHEHLAELRREAFAPHNAFSVGETPGIGQEIGRLMTHPSRGELDMIFSFDHLELPGKVRFDEYEYDLNYYKQYMIDWQEHYGADCWMSLFFDNHDNPRMLSKVDHSHAHREPLAKLLALLQLTLRGTPFLYQGQELGLTNHPFTDISQLKDVESVNKYAELCETMPPEAAFRKILAGSRDHARIPIDWSAAEGNEVLAFYKKTIALRKAMVYAPIEFLNKKQKNLFAYRRGDYTVVCNLSAAPISIPRVANGTLILCSYPSPSERLLPYEGRLYIATHA